MSKRTIPDDDGQRKRAKDWRDAFLDEPSRERPREHRRDDRDSSRDRYRRDRDERDRYKERDARGGPRHHDHDATYSIREHERGKREEGSRRFGNTSRQLRRESDREEGEITPPAKHPKTEEKPAPASKIPEPEPEPVIEEPVILQEEHDPEKVIEERRRKREEIMAKFKNAPKEVPKVEIAGTESVTTAGTRTGLQTGAYTNATPMLKKLGTTSVLAGSATSSTPNVKEPTLAATPMGHFDLAKGVEATTTEGASAADYDPSAAGEEDRAKREEDKAKQEEDEYEEIQMEVDEEEEEVDMFAAFEEEDRPKKKRTITVRRRKNGEIIMPKAKIATVVDNIDDTEGYYRITPGEILDEGRYQVTINLGKGMFSGVVKAKVLKAVDQERRQDVVGKEVAIKVIRSQESMYVAAHKEVALLRKLNEADPEDKKHIVRMERTFEHHGHLCIVTESLSMNLRDVIKRFGKDVGLNMRAVRAYAHQLFLALSLLRKCSIVHADIKPDNILVSENKTTLKVCDLGSAADAADGDITPYLVSRFYRAPEIILGLPYDTSIDIWSIGCTLYELYTGKILFPGRSNNHMLRLMMEVKGKINHRLIKKAAFGEMYFDESMNFLSVEKDKITGADVLKTLAITNATRDLRSRLLPPSSVQVKMKEDELKQMLSFVDLLDKCLHLDPAKRITPRDALLHPFVAG